MLRARVSTFLIVTTALAACLPGGGSFLDVEEIPPPSTDFGDGGLLRGDADPGDPFAIDGLTPSHGPYTGGTRANIAGRGFSTKLRVFIDGVEIPQGSLIASDPTRAAIVTPPGKPGFVDVMIRDEATAKERILKDGFYYDAIDVVPNTGVTSGGTKIAVHSGADAWAAGATVFIDGKPCDSPVISPTDDHRIDCTTPPGTPGAKDVVVKQAGKPDIQAREAFTYNDSPDGYRGGLSGPTFAGRLKVLAFNAVTGAPIPGAYAIAGDALPGAVVKQTGTTGVTEFDGLPGTKVTATVVAPCHQPMTFVDVPVDTVTAYLDPIFDLACIEMSDPPSTGGNGGRFGGIIEGQLVFPGKGEFEKGVWTTVPLPTKPTERRAAYVFEASSSPNAVFQLPPPSEAITPDSPGGIGYQYSIVVFPGNATIYVVAGLEDRSETPPRFSPYAMGVARGISVPAQTRVQNVDIKMDILFDHLVTLAPDAPPPGPTGPDRFSATVAVTLGPTGYGILPNGHRLVPLPAPANVPFVGVPSLDNALAGESYVLGAVAATGPDLQIPASVVSRVRTTNANTPVALSGFLPIPVPQEPGSGTWNGTTVSFDAGGPSAANLEVIRIRSGNGLSTWTIVAPGGVTSFGVPDLRQLPPSAKPLGLYPGLITTIVNVARIDEFEYGKLRLGQLSSNAWNAHASDGRVGAY